MSTTLQTYTLPSGLQIEIAQGDLTQEPVDAVVNAANRHLQHGGGLAAALLRRGGPIIQQESDAWVQEHGPVSHELPAWTHSGSLPCKYIIHTVGPVWGEGAEDEKLTAAVQGSLDLAVQLDLQSIALPAISTGIFGFPRELAARVILGAICSWAADHPNTSLTLARLTLFDDSATQDFLDAADTMKL